MTATHTNLAGPRPATETAIAGAPGETESWSPDALGNWSGETTDGSAVGRTNDDKNEFTSTIVTTPGGGGGSSTYTLAYDHDGNMVTDDQGYSYTYDAWNRLVLEATPGYQTAAYTYTADGRDAATSLNCGGLESTPADSYYDLSWRVVETDYTPGGCGPAVAASQYVWGLTYVNDLVERDDAGESGDLGITGSGLGRRLYAVRDANHDVAAVTDDTGAVGERFAYDPYGMPTVLDASTYAATTDVYGTPGNDLTWWNVGFQGGVQMQPPYYSGAGTAVLIQFDNRVYDAGLGRWVQQDPAGYVDGSNTYGFARGNPVAYLDPSGLLAASIGVEHELEVVQHSDYYLNVATNGWEEIFGRMIRGSEWEYGDYFWGARLTESANVVNGGGGLLSFANPQKLTFRVKNTEVTGLESIVGFIGAHDRLTSWPLNLSPFQTAGHCVEVVGTIMTFKIDQTKFMGGNNIWTLGLSTMGFATIGVSIGEGGIGFGGQIGPILFGLSPGAPAENAWSKLEVGDFELGVILAANGHRLVFGGYFPTNFRYNKKGFEGSAGDKSVLIKYYKSYEGTTTVDSSPGGTNSNLTSSFYSKND